MAVETWLNDLITSNMISEEYTIIRNDRTNKKGGGVLIAFKNHYRIVNVKKLQRSRYIETIFVEHRINDKIVLYGCVYVPPPVTIEKFNAIDDLFSEIDAIRDSYDAVFIFGDFNCDMNKSNKLSYTIDSHMFSNLVKTPTREDKVLDLFLTDTEELVISCKVVENISNSCDHSAILTELCLKKAKITPQIINVFKPADITIFEQEVRELFNNLDATTFDTMNFINSLNQIHDRYLVPVTTKNKRKTSERLENLIKQKRKYVKGKDSQKIRNNARYVELSSSIKTELEAISNEQIEDIINKSDSLKEFYRYIKRLTSQAMPMTLTSDEKILDNEADIVEAFKNLFYKYKLSDIDTKVQTEYIHELSTMESECTPTNEIDIRLEHIYDTVNNLNLNKSYGLHSVPKTILRTYLLDVVQPMYQIVHNFVTKGSLPDELRTSLVKPIPKAGKPSDELSSYRPITLMSNVMKVIDTVISDNINKHMEANKSLINSNQYGFTKNMRIEYQIIDLIKNVRNHMSNKKITTVFVLFLDFSSAFDTIDRLILYNKLYNLGIRGNFLNTIKKFLSERSSVVQYKTKYSEPFPTERGVPQGGVTSPTLFNLYTSDFPTIPLHGTVYQFADDTAILFALESIDQWVEIQEDLIRIEEYCRKNALILNGSKSVCLNFKDKDQILTKCNLIINGEIVPFKLTHKHLGMIIDTKLSFNSNIDYITKK